MTTPALTTEVGSNIDQDREAVTLANRYWQGLLRIHPLLATAIGETRFDHLLPDPSVEGRARAEGIHREALQAVRGFDLATLDAESRRGLEIVRTVAARELTYIELRMDRFEAATQMGDPWLVGPGNLISLLGGLHTVADGDALDRYERRLRAVSGWVASLLDVLEDAVAAGQTMPRPVVLRTIQQVERLLVTEVDSSPALKPVVADERAREAIAAVLREVVLPAYERLLTGLRRYHESARDAIGLGAIAEGDTIYQACIRGWTSLEVSPRELHERGLADLKAIDEERAACARRLGMADPAEAAVAYRARGLGPRDRSELMRRAQDQIERSWEASGRWFGRLPSANCEVRFLDASREMDTLENYQPATADGSRPAIFFLNGRDPAQRPLHRLAAWTYHEANPGHHLQIGIEQAAGGRSDLRRFIADYASGAFVEGWGLYAERLADEMGLYRDEYERLGMLEQQAFRAARLVVDTGIHAFGWPRERAARTLGETGLGEAEAAIEIDRYIAIPAQAVTYRVGQISIERWREAAAGAERLVAFHDRLLELGSLPLSILDRELDGTPAGATDSGRWA